MITTPWTNSTWPFLQWQEVMEGHGDQRRWWREYRFRWPWSKPDPEPTMITQEDVDALARIVEKPFDWLTEYGPLWEPGSPAFWLAPTTPDELASWYAKYRYGQDGVFSADNIVHGGVIISVTANADRRRMYQEAEQRRIANAAQYKNANHFAQAGLNNQMAMVQQQAWAASQAEQMQNAANALNGYNQNNYFGPTQLLNRRFLGRH